MFFKRNTYKIKKKEKDVHEVTLGKYRNEGVRAPSGERIIVNEMSRSGIFVMGGVLLMCLFFLTYRTMALQVYNYDLYKEVSENNSFTKDITFAKRGFILDRNGERLAWNEQSDDPWSGRITLGEGFGHILGYVVYPEKDSTENFFRFYTEGKEGIEKIQDETLKGKNGSIVIERNAQQDVIAERFIEKAVDGDNVYLTIDKHIQTILYNTIKDGVIEREFSAGTGAVVDIKTGELYALTSYPDYDTQVFNRKDQERIKDYLSDERKPIFNRAVSGVYAPGSVVKPFFGVAFLEEGIVNRSTSFESTGTLVVENRFDPDNPSIFLDWKPHGIVNIIDAIAVSSNIFFYIAGGGYKNREGLGILRIEEYADFFHLTRPTEIGFLNEPTGVVPSPEWKREVFGDEWYVGDTYNTVIGQYGFLLTPIQILRGIAALANDGVLIEPRIIKDTSYVEKKVLPFSQGSLDTIQYAMRQTTLRGTATSLKQYPLAIKTGTSQIGDERINSLITGFYPYNNPRYAFIIIMEDGPETPYGRGGAVSTAKVFFDALAVLDTNAF